MKRIVTLILLLAVAAPAWAASKPLAPGTYTVPTCPPPVVCPQCPPPTVCADAALCPTCPACPPAPVQVQPLPVAAPDCPDARLVALAGPEDPPRPRWQKVAAWVGGALLFRHIILSLDDDHGHDNGAPPDSGCPPYGHGHDCD